MNFYFSVFAAFDVNNNNIVNNNFFLNRFINYLKNFNIIYLITDQETYFIIKKFCKEIHNYCNEIIIINDENLNFDFKPEENINYKLNNLPEVLNNIINCTQNLNFNDYSCVVIGCENLYKKAIENPKCKFIYKTEFYNFSENLKKKHNKSLLQIINNKIETNDKNIKLFFSIYLNKNYNLFNVDIQHNFKIKYKEEYKYLHLVQKCIYKGIFKEDRTGTGTFSLFGKKMTFNLKNNTLPVLTTKKISFSVIVKELLWFISGSTNAKVLTKQNVHIWDSNSSKTYLNSIGLNEREEGDLGPIYGFQWRHYGANYKGIHHDYKNEGFDQLSYCINLIKNDPNNRRIILNSWNPTDIPIMALPPCHMMCQFYVRKNKLDCIMHQRSCDMGLGVPFNIVSYSLLTIMIAQICNLKPGKFIHSLGDLHVYSNHVEPLLNQLDRIPRPFPKLIINRPNIKNIDDFEVSDFKLVDYNPYPQIKMKMSV